MSDSLDTWLTGLLPGEAAPAPADALPAVLGLTDAERVATGPLATVWRAWDAAAERHVAVKVSTPGDPDAAAALTREARLTARLEHPGVLPVHRVVSLADRVCVELRWGSSRTLVHASEALRLDPPPLSTRLALVRSLADTLAHAHARGLPHGDVHPGNVLLGDAAPPSAASPTATSPALASPALASPALASPAPASPAPVSPPAPSPAGPAWLCDWGASLAVVGHPGYASPERLGGAEPAPAHDVYSLGVIAWELCSARELRTRRHEESLGAWVARSLATPVPPVPGVSRELAALVAAMTRPAAARPTAAAVVATLDHLAAEAGIRAWADATADAALERARAAVVRHRGLVRRRVEEERVVAVLRAKVPPYAPALDKRPIREAEDRVRTLAGEAADATLDALDAVACARTLATDPAAADALAAEVWWERLTEAEAAGDDADDRLARRHIDDAASPAARRVADRMNAPGTLSLTADAADAVVTLERVVERGERLLPERVDERPLPLADLPLAPGSWLCTVRAPGRAPVVLPVWLDRLESVAAHVHACTPAQVGEGWCFVPAGPFRMGGDPGARNPLAACSPHVGDRFVLRTCVTSAEYQAFLDDLPEEEARARSPGEVGLFGERSHYWARVDGRWTLPPGWAPDWPVMGVCLDDAQAYARWRSAREGRVVRVPTEEEWEKASRGVDGRFWPWGNRFDPTHCHMRESRPGPPRPAPVGAYPVDASVYGVLDTAGGMREWTTSTYQEGQVVVRGGTWGDDADDCRCASRAGLQPAFRMPWVGFRLVSEVPRPS